MSAFHKQLRAIAGCYPDQIIVARDRSNFTTVEFRDSALQQRYLNALTEVDPGSIGTKAILGRPKTGAGEVTRDQLVPEQQLSPELLTQIGILGLPNTAVRLSTLSHRFVLDVLDRVLAEQ